MTITADGASGKRMNLKRQAELGAGLGMIALSAFFATSIATWNVADPSWSQANRQAIENAAGAPGAITADILMQVLGLGAALIVVWPLIWGVLYLIGKPLDRLSRKGWLAVAGIALVCAALGCLPESESWPLPIGLGGVIGDIVLKVPALFFGGYPSGFFAVLVGLLAVAPGARLFLGGSGLWDLKMGNRPAPTPVRHASHARRLPQDDLDGQEGKFALVMGALAHVVFSARSAIDRVRTKRAESRREFGDRFDDWNDQGEPAPPVRNPSLLGRAEPQLGSFHPEMPAVQPPHEPEVAHRGVSIRMPGQGQDAGFFDPFADQIDEDDFAQPAMQTRPAPAPQPARDPYGLPQVTGRFDAPFEAPVQPAADADPFANHAWYRPGDPNAEVDRNFESYDDGSVNENAYFEPQTEPAPQPAAGGWRGLLPGNIVAFPGRRPKFETPQPPRNEPGFDAGQPAAQPKQAERQQRQMPRAHVPASPSSQDMPAARAMPQTRTITGQQAQLRGGSGKALAMQPKLELPDPETFELPSVEYLTPPPAPYLDETLSEAALADNARLLESVLQDFGVKGEIMEVRPGPVVTLYELEPAPGIKSSRVIGLADDIARSMSAIAARVAVIPGKNAIGIELPNPKRETVYFREMIDSPTFAQHKGRLPVALGKTIGGEPVIADLAKMPHLLVAGTTGSGKSVAINTMISSLLYRHSPAECRLIMIDPKMLELSIYDGIPHLLSPVVTDPKKAVVALKWTVREMEDRYRKMAKVGVRNIDGFNQRVKTAQAKGETLSRTVQTGFDRDSGEPIFETEEFDLQPLPYIVVIIDEMADLMMVAGKEIEGAVQRLAQMARAAGIHVIMATQRPSTDVITGTIKANFPTRISFQVTSKIDSRVMLGESGAEQLLGMGDMLFMTGGGRIQRVHGPFVDDAEVEGIVSHLKAQGVPDYLDAVLEDDEDEDDGKAGSGKGGKGGGNGAASKNAAPADDDFDDSDDPYDQAVAVVLRDGKASTSYIQRRLGIGYNRAASIIEKMEKEGVVGPANHAGKREILVPTEEDRM
ncbi:cell division protein FtsK, putative [Fulvimarina pelagi HTCC2506]|uniref:DNA translocase FtsK n=2 Tax=Fulvimarina pelagi TaxID=217511 RepID=Q0G0A7_9HYPH|nr:DNA translocase FtsK [Fulvimarina pelagi]EAU40686.1 cell division protein FtsK, putative [Fulvimarina pelagi HTCC2506]BAT31229.1 cell division protein FtsK [Fulvimarina pelagi]